MEVAGGEGRPHVSIGIRRAPGVLHLERNLARHATDGEVADDVEVTLVDALDSLGPVRDVRVVGNVEEVRRSEVGVPRLEAVSMLEASMTTSAVDSSGCSSS